MESLSETEWDVVISGTGLQQSLLALALSRSDKKVLHVDQNDYYGGAEAAFSLQEIEEWVNKIKSGTPTRPFQNASFSRYNIENATESEKLSFARAYTLSLSPQIIYTRAKLLSELVSSKVYRQLEFQAVGNWWIYDASNTNPEPGEGTLKRLPNGREDIFMDSTIDLRAKRGLMKFLKFVVDYENQREVWEPSAAKTFAEFLSTQFQLPPSLQTVIHSLTLSLDPPDQTLVSYALPRIARHLTSIGVFGPGFGAVVPKWGGGSEIAQVACRAGAVGGGVYVLGTGVTDATVSNGVSDGEGARTIGIILSSGDDIRSKTLASEPDHTEAQSPSSECVSKIMGVVSSSFASLFATTVEDSPLAAVTVVVFPSSFAVAGSAGNSPIYIMVHSCDTGECPVGQCIIYVTSRYSSSSKARMEAAISTFLQKAGDGDAKLLYSVYYEQQRVSQTSSVEASTYRFPDPSLDLAFDDSILENVEQAWNMMIGGDEGDVDLPPFMQFDDRPGMNADEEDGFND
ncbi:hypothetical protein B7463_g5691, partial [Scytalidium lignicola]